MFGKLKIRGRNIMENDNVLIREKAMASLYREKTDDGLIQRDTVTYTGESFYTHRVEEVLVYHN